jgi:4-alpha-glucanotransferase
MNGKFDPERKKEWESHGKNIVNAMLKASNILPCAEDLGTVPECSYKTLKHYGIPGIDFQRFYKKKNYDFYKPREYRKNSSSVISTHDSSFFPLWWRFEAGTIDRALFEFLCRSNNIKGKTLQRITTKLFDKTKSKKGRLYWNINVRSTDKLLKILGIKKQKASEIVSLFKESCSEKEKFLKYLYGHTKTPISASPALQKKCIERAGESESIFSIQLMHEYLFMDSSLFGKMNKWSFRVNSPGMVSKNNWSLRLPLSLENLLNTKKGNEIAKKIRLINIKTNRY